MQKEELIKFDLPDSPGVYLFTLGKGRSKKVLYVGKATSLRDRVRSYFDIDLIVTRGPRIVDMVTKADGISYEAVPTVLEALVRESALIREHQPKANVEGKDDKTFLYAVITKEEFPRVLAVREKDIDFKTKTAQGFPYKDAYGPFPSGNQLRAGLRLIRKIFPFYDTARPVGVKSKHQRAKIEFNKQIGAYPKTPDKKAYARNIQNISLFLSGRVKTLRAKLEKDMKDFAREERFEDAGLIRKQLFAIDHVQDVSLIRDEYAESRGVGRIEAYDTAHLSGTNAIGVMVVVEDGRSEKREYRTFKIRGVGGKTLNDDIASLKEIVSRRLGHPEWGMPSVIVVDGGKTHKKAVEEVLVEYGVGIPVVAVVKNEKHRPREIIGSLRAKITDSDAVLANSEAHRFAVSKHRALRSKSIRG